MARTVDLFFQIYYILIFVRVIISWVRPRYNPTYNRLASAVYAVTEPLLAPIRQLLPPMGGFDFSPIIALILISMVRRAVWQFLNVTLTF